MKARPNLNGNSPEDFLGAANDLYEAANELEGVMNKHLGNITHGRNYQLSENPYEDREADLAEITRIYRSVNSLRAFALDLFKAGS